MPTHAITTSRCEPHDLTNLNPFNARVGQWLPSLVKMAPERDRNMALFRRLRTPLVEELLEGEAALQSGPRSAGDALRQQREALGLDLDDVAAALRIKPDYLAALEAGRPDLLPGPTYAIGFVRTYSDHLGLDGSEILRRFKAESAGLEAKTDLAFPMPLGERSIPGKSMLLLALILMLCGYGTWHYLSTSERSRPERVAEVPIALLPAPLADGVATPPASETTAELQPATRAGAGLQGPAPTGSDPGPIGGAVVAPPPTPSGQVPDLPATMLAPPPAPPPVLVGLAPTPQSEATRAYGPVDGPTRIVIRATSESWIKIRDANQTVLLEGFLKVGETYRVPDRPGVSMRTGNAGGLDITVDGKPVPPIGGMGAVRNVRLEPQALMSGPAAGG
jgi:cytoskeleton protein RodZ